MGILAVQRFRPLVIRSSSSCPPFFLFFDVITKALDGTIVMDERDTTFHSMLHFVWTCGFGLNNIDSVGSVPDRYRQQQHTDLMSPAGLHDLPRTAPHRSSPDRVDTSHPDASLQHGRDSHPMLGTCGISEGNNDRGRQGFGAVLTQRSSLICIEVKRKKGCSICSDGFAGVRTVRFSPSGSPACRAADSRSPITQKDQRNESLTPGGDGCDSDIGHGEYGFPSRNELP
jgi:hypothetical protein